MFHSFGHYWRFYLYSAVFSICVTELQTVMMDMMRMQDFVQQLEGPQWRKHPASSSLCWHHMDQTILRNCLDLKQEITCSNLEESILLLLPCLVNWGYYLGDWPFYALFRVCYNWWIWSKDGPTQNWCWTPEISFHGCGKWRYWNAEVFRNQGKFSKISLLSYLTKSYSIGFRVEWCQILSGEIGKHRFLGLRFIHLLLYTYKGCLRENAVFLIKSYMFTIIFKSLLCVTIRWRVIKIASDSFRFWVRFFFFKIFALNWYTF